MSTGSICTDEPPGSDSSATNQPCQDTQTTLQVIKVPSKKILNIILDKLDLPRAKYEFHEAGHHQVYATVAFYISDHKPDDILDRIVMEGVLSTDSEIAEESVALEGIRYMENLENIVVEDLNFSELRYVQEQNRALQARLDAAEESRLTQSSALHLALTGMIGISHRMYDLTDKYRSAGQAVADTNNNAVLEQFDNATMDLQRLTARLTRFL